MKCHICGKKIDECEVCGETSSMFCAAPECKKCYTKQSKERD